MNRRFTIGYACFRRASSCATAISMSDAVASGRPLDSVDSDLTRYFKDPRVRLAFTFQSKYLGMSPFQCPSLFTILSFLEYEYGVLHPRGGCGAVSQAMARVAGEMGVRFRLNVENRINFRVDYAWGENDEEGLYVSVGEAF